MERALGANLGGVRLHTDARAAGATRELGAEAFTSGRDVFFADGRSQPSSPQEQRVLAHELTHVVQQGQATTPAGPRAYTGVSRPTDAAEREADRAAGAIQAGRTVQVRERSTQVQRLLPAPIRRGLNRFAEYIPGYSLFTVIIGYNPLLGETVDRNATNLVRGLLGLAGPVGTLIFDKLHELGIIQDAFTWVKGELRRLDLSLGRIERVIREAWDEVQLRKGFEHNLDVVRGHFRRVYDDVVSFARSLVSGVMDMIRRAAVSVAEPLLAENRAWALIKKILRYDPLRDEPVEATTVEILEDFLVLIGREQELEQMRERGTLQETADWLDTQLATFLGLLAQLRGLITDAWEAIQPQNLPNLMSNLRGLATRAFGFLEEVWDFASTVALKVVEFIKNALLGWLSEFAHEVPGFHLVTVILGRNPFTGDRVPRTAENIIRGFVTLLPNGNATYQQLQESGAIGQAAARIEGALAELGISWEYVVGLFTGIWESLTIADLIDPIGAFQRIRDQFGEPISRLFAFIRVVIQEVFKLILEMMNFPSDLLGSIISNVMQAFGAIRNDPVGFLLNMLAAVKQGFSSFFDNILQHLLGGLTEWLFRGLRDAGIQPPTSITLESILNLVMQVLGLTAERIWQKLAERIGQENVDRIRGAIDRLVGIWNFVRDVQQRGVAAIWEYIQSQISNLWNMVLEQARAWIMERIINRAIRWLMSLLDPTGIMPVINSFIAFFNAVQSAIEYMRDILGIINDYVSTLAAVARGALTAGAQKLEQGLANAIPIAIGFLANQFGLSNIGEKIGEIVAGIRGLIDRALNWLMDRAQRGLQGVMGLLGLRGEEEEEAGEEVDDVYGATSVAIRNRLGGPGFADEDIQQTLLQIQGDLAPMGLRSLELAPLNERGGRPIVAEASPGRVLGTLSPEDATVSLRANISLGDERPVLERLGEELHFGTTTEGEGVTTRVRGAPGQPETVRIRRPTEPQVLEVEAWNTTVTIGGTNVSHAEAQFVAWLLNRPDAWLERVTSINIQLTHSPCDQCARSLEGVRNSFERLGKPEVVLRMTWGKPWRETTGTGIGTLIRARWEWDGPVARELEEAVEKYRLREASLRR